MNWQNKNVLITGISGFVGPCLAEELLKRGANVFGLIRRRSDGVKPKNLVNRRIIDIVHLLEGDINNLTSLVNAINASQPDIIFHLAAQSDVAQSFYNPIETQQINCLGTANLLEAVRLKKWIL